MAEENPKKIKPRKKIFKRVLAVLLILIAVLFLLVTFLVPAFVSSEKCKQIILAQINDSVEGQVNFADLSMSWPKGIRITDLSFNDDSGDIAVQVSQISVKPRYLQLLTGNLSLGQARIDAPTVEIKLRDLKSLPRVLKMSSQGSKM